ncbi:MAG: hypothetical protein EOR08_22875 [Mesorhizobium sp.]|nr:MAG: hypothetical protein EOR08_22875 [Mesorhizobium sp.]TIM66538.1 MAG: hypothetical protein E5Y58_22480 [Mesorhizobium sp.]
MRRIASGRMRGAPAWHCQHSVQHPSSVSALRADPPSPTRGEGRGALAGALAGLDFPGALFMCRAKFPASGCFPVLQRPRLHEHNGLIQWPKPQTSRSSFCRPPTPVSFT